MVLLTRLEPDVAAVDTWEPLSRCRDRLLPAELKAEPPDVDAWRALAMPDVIELLD